MTYVEGFVAPIPHANRERFIEHTRLASPFFREFGATRVVDAIGDDVPHGALTDFHRAVRAAADETVGFGFMEYADKATRDAAVARMMSDPRMAELPAMPFDGRRMIFSGFEIVFDEGPRGRAGYVEGFVGAVPTANRSAFVEHCRAASRSILGNGALRHVEGWGDDVQRGAVTDFFRAVNAEDGETIIFSWIEWPDRASRDRGQKGIFAEMETLMREHPMPFDGKRMIHGGFAIVHEEAGGPAA